MHKSSQFLIITIALDIPLMMLAAAVAPPGQAPTFSAIAVFGVSPLIAYLLVYRTELGDRLAN